MENKKPDFPAFTLGNTSGYDRSLAEEAGVKKIGLREDYDGGWVWRTEADARAFLQSDLFGAGTDRDPRKYSVYLLALPCPWEECCSPEPHPADGVHRLWKDAPILRKVVPS